MEKLHCHIAFVAMIFALIILLGGCAIGIRPKSHDESSEDDAYYEESYGGSPYNLGSRSGAYYHHDPNYDPWTMGTYYQYYSGPARSDRGSDTGSSRTENKRPTSNSRDSVSGSQSKAPNNEETSLRKSRSSIRDHRKKTSEPVSSPISSQKVRSGSKRNSSRTPKKTRLSNETDAKRRQSRPQINSQKVRRKKEEAKTVDEEDQNKASQK